MRSFSSVISIFAFFLSFLVSSRVTAQDSITIPDTLLILDAHVNSFGPGDSLCSNLVLYVTDSSKISDVEIQIGSSQDSTDIYDQQFPISNLPVNSKFNNNILSVYLGRLQYASEYYFLVKLTSTDNINPVYRLVVDN